jgi:hypothetical protein
MDQKVKPESKKELDSAVTLGKTRSKSAWSTSPCSTSEAATGPAAATAPVAGSPVAASSAAGRNLAESKMSDLASQLSSAMLTDA